MNLNKILRYISLGGIFLLPFVPLLVSSSFFFPFITTKNLAFRILVEIIVGSWLILLVRDSTYRPRRSLLMWTTLLFTALIGIADLTGVNPFKSMWSNFERMEGWVTTLHLFGYFLAAGSLFSVERLRDRFLQVSLGVSGILGIYGLMQLAGRIVINQGGVRLDATFGNASYLAVYMLFHIFFALYFLLRKDTVKMARYGYGALIILQLVILYYTATRGTILGLIGGGFLTALLLAIFEKERIRVRKFAVGVIVAMLVVVAGFFAVRNTSLVKNSPVLSRFANISLEETTTKSRVLVWGIAYKGFKERPLLGWGQENFNYVFNKYYDPGMYAQEPWFDRSHNIIMDWLIAGGILGLFSYLSIFAALLYYLWSKKTGFSVAEKSLWTGMLAAYFFQNLFVFDNVTSYILFFSFLAYVHSKRMEQEPMRETRVMLSPAVHTVVAPLVAVATIVAIYFFNINGMLASNTLLTALVERNNKTITVTNLNNFKKALAYDSFGNTEIREQLLQIAPHVQNSSAADELKKDFFDLAKSEMEKHIAKYPGDARQVLFLASFLNQYGRSEEALKYLEEALKLSPKKQSIYFEIGSSYLAAGKYKEAQEILKTAYELEPNYPEAAKIYALALIYADEQKLADDLLMEKFGTTLILDDRFVKVYAQKQQYAKVEAIWLERVKQEPNNPQFHLSLAATYAEEGKTTEAIAELERVKELSPESTEQVDFYIKELREGKKP